ncbi:MAG: M48 family metallopeptidase [Candidatus Delongbacteria bacterium]|jgi:predicted metal-dependent hydrolase|nr:M48 family metallopeptidase [Candidatus Delongbacteria bacterium]
MVSDKYEIIVQRSKRRKKTLQATLRDNTVKILAPHHTSYEDVKVFLNKFLKKLVRKDIILNNDKELLSRAKKLKKKFLPDAPDFTIVFQKSLTRIWGKCFTNQRKIVINPILGTYPKWVLDFVIVHEIAHLLVPNHGKEFRSLVDRFKLKERAVGFLMAKGMKEDSDEL